MRCLPCRGGRVANRALDLEWITTDPKSRKSKAPIRIVPKLATKLEVHRARLGKPRTGPIFPNEAGNATDPDSLLRGVILPRLRSASSVASQSRTNGGRAMHKYE
jgi:hypothetical protein